MDSPKNRLGSNRITKIIRRMSANMSGNSIRDRSHGKPRDTSKPADTPIAKVEAVLPERVVEEKKTSDIQEEEEPIEVTHAEERKEVQAEEPEKIPEEPMDDSVPGEPVGVKIHVVEIDEAKDDVASSHGSLPSVRDVPDLEFDTPEPTVDIDEVTAWV